MSKKKKDTNENAAVEESLQEAESTERAAQSETTVPDEAKSPEEQAQEEAQIWKDKYLRQLAEFDNFRKRTRQDSENTGRYARESLLLSLLPVKDDFDRMFASEFDTDESLKKGVEMIYSKLTTFFDAQQVTKMDGRGCLFDPDKHEALMMQPTADFPPGTILEVITPGYMVGDRVLRHAQVMVSAEPEANEESESGETSTGEQGEA